MEQIQNSTCRADILEGLANGKKPEELTADYSGCPIISPKMPKLTKAELIKEIVENKSWLFTSVALL